METENVKDGNCGFVLECKLTRSCKGCKIPMEARKYDDLYEYRTKYNDNIYDCDVFKAAMGKEGMVQFGIGPARSIEELIDAQD